MKPNRINQMLALVALCLLATQYAPAQSHVASPQPAQQIAAKVDEYMNAAVRVNHFSGSVLVARDGQPVISKGYGMANYELGVPNMPGTVLRLGSLTKQFTAMAVMMLQERGKLNVTDSICKYLSDCPAAWQPVTIRHLLTHTSGIPSYTGLPDYGKTQSLPVTHASLIERFKDKPLESAPGEKFKYNNSGYYLLGVIIERTSGKTYAEFLQENTFKPLGMTSTGYDSSQRIIKNRAAGYEVRDGSLINAPYIDMSIPFAAGALYSTVEDMLRWEQALYTEKLLTRKSVDEMFTPFKDHSPGRGYAFGWWLERESDRQAVSHSGHVDGFANYIMRFMAERVTIIVLSNNKNAPSESIAKNLAAIAFGAPYKIPQERNAIALDPRILEQYVGQYQLRNNIITITIENGRLMWQAAGSTKLELFAESETDFFVKNFDAQVRFIKDAQGRVTELVRNQGGSETSAPKIK